MSDPPATTDPGDAGSSAADAAAGEPAPLPRFRLLDVALTGVRIEEAVAAILRFCRDGGRRYVCVFAVDSLLKCRDNPRLAAIANASAMTICDGMPLVLVGRLFGRLRMSRCYGPDVMLRVADEGRAIGLRHWFYGGRDEETVRLLEENLQRRFPGMIVAGHEVPPFRPPTEEERRASAARIDAAGADIVWVGIGTPKQDFWIGDMRPLLRAPLLVAVGAAFDFHAGKVPQAPVWMRRCCLEWLYRLCAEPRRLWRRYLIGNPRFLWLLFKQLVTRRPDPLGARVYP